MPGGMPAVVPMDVPCRKCGYNLRGLSVEGRCPECGVLVGLSTYGDLLCYSDPVWLAKLRSGVSLILWGVLVMVVTVVLVVVVAIVLGARAAARAGGTAPPATGPGGMQAVLISLAPLAGYALMVAGSWLLTEPDPSGLGEDQYGTARKLIRVMLGIGVLNYLISAGMTMGPVPLSAYLGLHSLNFLCQVAGMVGTLAQLQYLKKLAARIPDDALAGRAQTIMWGYGVSYGIVMACGFISILILRPGMAPVITPGAGAGMGVMGALAVVGCFTFIAGIAALVFGIMYLFMLERYRRAFTDQAKAAQATWAANTAPASGASAAPPLPGMA
jgi:heme/copper-type cytochrome/quinol oxidase subunit 2